MLRWSNVLALVCVVFVFLNMKLAGAQDGPGTPCDTYAASPADPHRKTTGIPFEKINPAVAVPACEAAVRKYPYDARLSYQLGRAYQRASNFTAAVDQYRKAAKKGYAPAQNNLGFMYENGLGVPKDFREAIAWVRRAAENGDRTAQFGLGVIYENGRGVQKDVAQASRWYRKAAEQGYEEAINALRKLAEQGNAFAQFNLGVMYENGLGVSKNLETAIAWYRKAAEQGFAPAQQTVTRLEQADVARKPQSQSRPQETERPKTQESSPPIRQPDSNQADDRAQSEKGNQKREEQSNQQASPASQGEDGAPWYRRYAVGGIIFWGLLILAGLSLIVRAVHRSHVRRRIAQKAAAIIEQHLPALIRRRVQLVRPDPYGKLLWEDWLKEVEYFIEEHIEPHLTPGEREAFAREQVKIEESIFILVETESEKNPAFLTFSDDMTPNEFETFCAEELRRAGWNARVTMQSRDQGVDVVAERDGIRVVIQSKFHSRPVGIKAVQEIVAARTHEQADYGVVVSNNRYTQDAEQLASTNKVFLLHFTDLCNLHDILAQAVPNSQHPEFSEEARKDEYKKAAAEAEELVRRGVLSPFKVPSPQYFGLDPKSIK